MKKITLIVVLVLLAVGSAFAQSDNNYLNEEQFNFAFWNGYHAVRWVNDTSERVTLFLLTYDAQWDPDYSKSSYIAYDNGWHYTMHNLAPDESITYYVGSINVYWAAISDDNVWGRGDVYLDEFYKKLELSYGETIPFTNYMTESGSGSQNTVHINYTNSRDREYKVKFVNKFNYTVRLYVYYRNSSGERIARFYDLSPGESHTVYHNWRWNNFYWSAYREGYNGSYNSWGQNLEKGDYESVSNYLKRIAIDYRPKKLNQFAIQSEVMNLD